MGCAWMVGPTLALALGACAAGPTSDDATGPANDDATPGASTPAGFETWEDE